MALVILVEKGLNCPVILCDHCGKEITDPMRSVYAWEEVDEGDQIVPKFFHLSDQRGEYNCFDEYEYQTYGKRHKMLWMHTADIFVSLLHNLHVTQRLLAERRAFMRASP